MNMIDLADSGIWVKSSSSFANGNCVEVAELPSDVDPRYPGGGVMVRNSRKQAGPVLVFTHDDDPGESRWFGSVRELAESRGLTVAAPAWSDFQLLRLAARLQRCGKLGICERL